MTFHSWKEMIFWEISYLSLGKEKLKPDIYLLNFIVRRIPSELAFVMVEELIKFLNVTYPPFH